jgi:hypothetical protein
MTIRSAARCFSAPRSVEENRGISYIARDANRFAVAYVYFESEPGRRAAANLMTKDEARRVAAGIAKLPELLRGRNDTQAEGWKLAALLRSIALAPLIAVT